MCTHSGAYFLSGFDTVSLLNGIPEANRRSLSSNRLCWSCGFLVTTAIWVSKSLPTDRYPVENKNVLSPILKLNNKLVCWGGGGDSVAIVSERTIPIERPPLVRKVRTNFCV
jgi:hypothetical protein